MVVRHRTDFRLPTRAVGENLKSSADVGDAQAARTAPELKCDNERCKCRRRDWAPVIVIGNAFILSGPDDTPAGPVSFATSMIDSK